MSISSDIYWDEQFEKQSLITMTQPETKSFTIPSQPDPALDSFRKPAPGQPWSTDLDWPAFARRVAWGAEPHLILKTLGLEPPPDHRPARFMAPGLQVFRQQSEAGEKNSHEYVLWWKGRSGRPGTSITCGTPGDVLTHIGRVFPDYTATGAALRQWLTWWGWKPADRAAATAPPPPMAI